MIRTARDRPGTAPGYHTGGLAIEDIYKRLQLLEDLVLNAGLSFGTPVSIDALGTAKTTGTVANMRGQWVRVSVESLGTNTTFSHNLGLTTPTGMVNVGWWWYWRHDGTNDGGGDTVSLGYIDGTIASDSIQLQVFASGSRTVSASHPIIVTAFFFPTDG